MKTDIINNVIKCLNENHDVTVVEKDDLSITITSSVGIPFKLDYNFYPKLSDESISNEDREKLLIRYLLSSLIFLEEVAYCKKTGIKNFYVYRTKVNKMEDIDNIKKAVDDINNMTNDDWTNLIT